MSKSYILSQEYNNDLRVTVDDDVQYDIEYQGEVRSMNVSFYREQGYNRNKIASFSEISRIVPESDEVIVERKQYNYPEENVPCSPVKQEVNPVITWERV